MPIASYRIDFHALPNATREAMPRRAKDFERGSRISGRGTGIASTGLLALFGSDVFAMANLNRLEGKALKKCNKATAEIFREIRF